MDLPNKRLREKRFVQRLNKEGYFEALGQNKVSICCSKCQDETKLDVTTLSLYIFTVLEFQNPI